MTFELLEVRPFPHAAFWICTNPVEQYRHELAKEELMLAIDSSTEITAQKVCTYLMRQLQSNPDFSVRTGGRKSE